MFSTVISTLFWILFPIGTLLTAARLVGTFWKNGQLTAARWHFDDLADEGPGAEIYRLTLASNRLATFACGLGLLLVVTAFAGLIGGGVLKLAAIAVSGLLALAADRIRTRHERLETGFERQAGEPLGITSRRPLGGVVAQA